MTQLKWLRNPSRAEWGIVLAGLLLAAMTAWLSWAEYSHTYHVEHEFHERNERQIVLLLERHVHEAITDVGHALSRIKRVREQPGTPFDLKVLMAEHPDIADYAVAALIIDARGRPVHSTSPVPENISFADSPALRAHAAQDDGKPYFGLPMADPGSGRRSFQVSLRLNKPDGAFDGMAVIAIDFTYWHRLLRDSDLGEDSVIVLLGMDGVPRAVHGHLDGLDLLKHDWAFITDAARSGTTKGAVASLKALKGAESWAYRVVGDFPLIVAACAGEARMSSSLARSTRAHAAGTAALIFMELLFAAALLKFFARQRVHAQERSRISGVLQQSEERFRAVFDQAETAMALRPVGRRDLPWQKVNRRFCEFLGYTEAELLRLPASSITLQEDDALAAGMDARIASGEITNYSREKQYLRKDGSTVWGLMTMTVLHFPDGQPAQALSIVQDVDARKRGEVAVRESEIRLRIIAEHIGEGLALYDADDRLSFFNETYKRLQLSATPDIRAGLSFEQLARDRGHLLATMGEITDIDAFVAERMRRHRNPSGVIERRRPDGGVHQIREVRTPDGYTVVSFVDVTELKRREAELRESEGRFRAIIAAEPECVAIVSTSGKLLEMNPAGLRMLEAGSLEELQATPFIKLIAPRFRKSFIRLRNRVRGGESGVLEFEAIGMRGKRCWLEIHAAPLRDGGGDIYALLGISRDVSEQHAAREALATERNLMRALIDNIPDLVHVKDTQSRYMLANAAWMRVRAPGWTDVTGRSSSEIVGNPQRLALLTTEDRGVIEENRPNRLRVEKVKVPGSGERWFMISKLPLHDATGRVTGLISISRDVTEIRQRTEEVEQLNAVLERRVEERTAELAAANEELEAFASAVSHDLRAPLRHIDGFAELLLDDGGKELSAAGRNYLGRIRNASSRMMALIEDLLRLSRLMRGDLRFTEVDLGALAAELAEELRREHPERKVQVTIGPGLQARCDAGLLRAALANLLQNAWKFTGKREDATIEFSASLRDGAKVFCVRDNGAGFDMAYAGRLFGTFQRLHHESEFSGTGVGLATVRRIVRRHGGDVWAESAVNEGASFYFTLGRRPAEYGARAPVSMLLAAEPQPPVSGASSGKPILLLVDDDADVLDLSSRMLRPDQYEVLTAGSGEQALALLLEHPVQVIVSDFSMPGMDGARLLAQAAQLRPQSLRLIVSSQDINQAMQAGLQCGDIHHYFGKQQDYQLVRDCIRAWVGARPAKN